MKTTIRITSIILILVTTMMLFSACGKAHKLYPQEVFERVAYSEIVIMKIAEKCGFEDYDYPRYDYENCDYGWKDDGTYYVILEGEMTGRYYLGDIDCVKRIHVIALASEDGYLTELSIDVHNVY